MWAHYFVHFKTDSVLSFGECASSAKLCLLKKILANTVAVDRERLVYIYVVVSRQFTTDYWQGVRDARMVKEE